jgi:3-hydroxy acid dehydrogenase / malonic semialdehyde reductase
MIAFLPGATSGIGKATSISLAKLGYGLIITGRRKNRLFELETKLQNEFGNEVISLNFDVRNYNEVKTSIMQLPEKWKSIDVLINNAGLAAGLSPLQDGELDDWERMIDTNIKGLLYVTKEVAPLMIGRNKGHIINIGSIAGKEVYEKGNVYCATKYAVEALTKGMRIDFLNYNIKVTSICPGAAETEFSEVRFKGDKEKAKAVYEGYTPLNAEDIAEAIVFTITRPPHVNINDMLIMPTAQASSGYLNRET